MTNAFTDLAVLERRLSVERLGPYRRTVDDDLAAAIALYEWNTTVAAAFWATLGHVEVVVRNAMDEQLSTWSVTNFNEPCCTWTRVGGLVVRLDATSRRLALAPRGTGDQRPGDEW